MKHKISVRSASRGLQLTRDIHAAVKKAVNSAYAHLPLLVSCEVFILLTDDAGIQEMNSAHRGVDKSTDVLSFPMLDVVPGQSPMALADTVNPETGCVSLGDIVISVETARRQAEMYGHSLRREIGFLAVHGLLHLLGYDHTHTEEEARMTRLQEEILQAAGLSRDVP